jgi:hypothetical protein
MTRLDRLRAEHGVSVCAASSRAAPGDGARAGPPLVASSPEPLDLGPYMIPGDALGRTPRGPLWRTVPLDEHQTWVVGPGFGFPLCAAGLDGLHAALSAARKERGL